MFSSLIRKTQQLANDPVLRRWLMWRLFYRSPPPPPFVAHRPPYLEKLLPLAPEKPSGIFFALADESATKPIDLALAGQSVRVEPGQEVALFDRSFDDVETLLSLHRFAWIRQVGIDVDPNCFAALWHAWCDKFSTPGDGWAWHPYTAAERAVNVLDFAEKFGLPDPASDTLSLLASHAHIISERLEYFGDHHTSNHLVNNGRGLYVLGLKLGMEGAAEMGLTILLEESKRLFGPSGMLREGSSHYHLLLTRLYQNVAKRARDDNRPEAVAFLKISERVTRAAENLILPAGLPLVGDISPDIKPKDLLGDLDLEQGSNDLNGDGWLRADFGPWSGLWHAAPEGFSHMPGHGHQDMGSFELHAGSAAVIVDPGRGAYGETGEAALYRSARSHNGLMMDGSDPFPANRPYYDETFRQTISGLLPALSRDQDSVSLVHHGFARLSGGGAHKRKWQFDGNQVSISDHLQGQGRHTVNRTLITTLNVEQTDDGVSLGSGPDFFLACPDTHISIRPVTRWTAYGEGEKANAIILSNHTNLPFEGIVTLELLTS
jgi:hypothetical protein